MSIATKKVGFKLLNDGEEKKTDDTMDGAETLQKIIGPASSTGSSTIDPSPATPRINITTNNNSSGNNNKSTTKKKKFRLPRFRSRRRSSATSSQGGGDSEEDEAAASSSPTAVSNDPVMDVFQKHLKHPRVRWSLDAQPVAEKYSPEKASTSNVKNDSNGALVSPTNSSNNSDGDLALTTVPSTSTVGSTKSNTSSNSTNIKRFVTGALFGSSNRSASEKEFQKEVAKEVEAEKDLVWESNTVCPDGGEVLYTTQTNNNNKSTSASSESQQLTIAFSENSKMRSSVSKLIKKGKRAQSEYYRYEYAIKYFVRALDMLADAKYPDMHPTVRNTLDCLNDAHHKLSSFNNSANIVKIGIKYEDGGELVRALKMYSIAYRIRRDNLSRTHPSLVVLLNMLGSIQTKRGEYEEAMKIYELALKDTTKHDQLLLDYPDMLATTPTGSSSKSAQEDDEEESQAPPPPPPPLPTTSDHDQEQANEESDSKGNLLARSVTYREMGTIFEKWDRREEALSMYHLSLDCVAEWKAVAGVSSADKGLQLLENEDADENDTDDASGGDIGELDRFMDKVCVKKSYTNNDNSDDQTTEKGEMEMLVCLDIPVVKNGDVKTLTTGVSCYDSFFPPHLEAINAKKGRSTASAASLASGDSEGLDRRDDYADIDVALTLHQIAQLFRKQGQFSESLEAYAVALRGMKYSLGNYHPNVAAILGNFGNLQKEMGDLDAAYNTYQEVLGIESYRLGLSHPDVAITLHNIATIDSARGNHKRALKLYEQVMNLQEKLFGRDHVSIAVTSACMGDAYEALDQMKDAFESYEVALRIKSSFLGLHSLEVARILHKLAKVALKRGDHRLACSYISRAIFVYRLNKIPDDHEWVVDGHRDSADIDASIALTKDKTFEC